MSPCNIAIHSVCSLKKIHYNYLARVILNIINLIRTNCLAKETYRNQLHFFVGTCKFSVEFTKNLGSFWQVQNVMDDLLNKKISTELYKLMCTFFIHNEK